jgi:hypothetical protein
MIQIKRNKFLTKIINNYEVSSILTKVFDEITGVTNLEYAKEFIKDEDIKNSISEANISDVYQHRRNRYAPSKIFIDDNEISFKKLLESWDLTYDMFYSAIKNATLFTVNNEILCNNYSYICGIEDIVDLYIRANIPFESEKITMKYINIDKSVKHNSNPDGFSGTDVLTTSLKFEVQKSNFVDNIASINIYDPDERIIENLIDLADKIYLKFSLFYNDEEWYFQELSRESIEKILSQCREFAQQIELNPPNSIMVSKIFHILWHQSVQGLKSGTIILQDIFGRKKRFTIKDLIPRPKYLLQQHLGKYLLMKTSKCREDVRNFTL